MTRFLSAFFVPRGAGVLPDGPQPKGLRKHVSLIVLAQLIASLGKRRARHPAREQIYALKIGRLEVTDVLMEHVPRRPIEPERCTGLRIDPYKRNVLKPGLFQSQCLAARSGANLE